MTKVYSSILNSEEPILIFRAIMIVTTVKFVYISLLLLLCSCTRNNKVCFHEYTRKHVKTPSTSNIFHGISGATDTLRFRGRGDTVRKSFMRSVSPVLSDAFSKQKHLSFAFNYKPQ
jgi:hypothetical protein